MAASLSSLRLQRRTLILLAVALVLLGLLWWGLSTRQSADAPTNRGAAAGWRAMPVPVRVVAAERGTLPIHLHALGTVTPWNSVTVRSQVEGELAEVVFEEGQHVEQGELLARIDPRGYEAALLEAEGQQQQNLALLENARNNLALYEGLWEQDSIARQELDNQQALVRQYEGQAKVDRARVDEARRQLEHTRIIAPISGQLGLRRVDAGNLVSRNDPEGLVTLASLDPIAVLFHLPEVELGRLLARLREGHALITEAWDRGNVQRLASGMLHTLDNQIDVETGTIALKARFDNQPLILFPNQFVNVRLHLDQLEDAVLIPSAAIQYGAQGTYVYVVDERRQAELRPVQEGPSSEQWTAITTGLAPGEQVVLEGLDRLRPGAIVELISTGVDPAELETVQVPQG